MTMWILPPSHPANTEGGDHATIPQRAEQIKIPDTNFHFCHLRKKQQNVPSLSSAVILSSNHAKQGPRDVDLGVLVLRKSAKEIIAFSDRKSPGSS